jgi:hypothetical protein
VFLMASKLPGRAFIHVHIRKVLVDAKQAVRFVISMLLHVGRTEPHGLMPGIFTAPGPLFRSHHRMNFLLQYIKCLLLHDLELERNKCYN